MILAALLNLFAIHGRKLYLLLFRNQMLADSPVIFQGSFAPDDIAVIQRGF
jgi:hypothetical protein